MREIKFQVFTTDWEGVTGCFEGYFLQLLDNGKYKVAFTNSDNDKEFITTERENIRLFTGLKDNNGKKIYEKGIVKYKNYGEEHISKVIQDFRLGTGHYIKSPGIGFYSINERTIKDLEIEVIGNVFEDSHLLEEQHG